MYRFKYYYKDGSTKLSDNIYNDIQNFELEIARLTRNKNFKTTLSGKKDFNDFLKLAINEYEKNFNDIYRIDIIDNNTNEILGYVDKSECLIDGKKGHLLYDPNSFEAVDAKIEDNYDNCIYKFKYYYNDGTTDFSDIRTEKPEELYNDFDGLIDWDEFDNFDEDKVTTKEILETAVRAYKGFLPDFYRIEIINDKTNEVVDYIDVKEVK